MEDLDRNALYEIWAPAASVWSPWVKPVLFAFWPRPLDPSDHARLAAAREKGPSDSAASVKAFPSAQARTALVVDLPGDEAVRVGVQLAERGYRPVPLFASCPSDYPCPCAVDADRILAALVAFAPALARSSLRGDAPPAFLIDADRAPALIVRTNVFDNRSALFPSDFPSAATLRAHGIERARLIQEPHGSLGHDLGHSLAHWRAAGLSIDGRSRRGKPLELDWPPAGFLELLAHRARLAFGLRPNLRGGYGRFIAPASAG